MATAQARGGPDGPFSESEEQRVLDLPPRMNVGKGNTFVFRSRDFEVAYSKLCQNPRNTVLAWNTIDKVDVEWAQFSATVILTISTGQHYSFEVRKDIAIRAASLIYAFSAKADANGDLRPWDGVKQSVMNALPVDPDVGITSGGLMIRRHLGFLKASFKFVSWEYVVSVSISKGSIVLVNTMVEEEQTEHKENRENGSEIHVGEEGEGSATLGEGGTDVFEEPCAVSIRTPSPQIAQALYDEIIRMMYTTTGLSRDQLVKQFTFDHGEEMRGSFDEVGFSIAQKSEPANCFAGCFGGVAGKLFVPWVNLAKMSWKKKSSCFGDSEYICTEDRAGHRYNINGATEEAFRVMRDKFITVAEQVQNEAVPHDLGAVFATIGKCGRSSGDGDVQSRLVRDGGVTCATDGLHAFREEGGASKMRIFVPWCQVDGLCMRMSCMGGSICFMMETGTPIQVTSTWGCGSEPLWDFYNRVQKLKYPDADNPADVITFPSKCSASCIRSPCNCDLTSRSLKLVVPHNIGIEVQEWALNRVIDCKAETGNKLVVSVRNGIYRKRVLVVPVAEPEDATQLAKKITERLRANSQ